MSDSQGPTWNGVVWGLTAVAAICVGLRIVSRTAFGRNQFGLDDGITLLCMAAVLAAAIATSLAIAAGAGAHIADVPPDQISLATYRILILNATAVWSFSLPKFAIIALLDRLLPLKKGTRIAFWTVAVINQCGILASAVMWFTRCSPTPANWDPTYPGASCGSFEPLEILGWITSAISAVLDIFFAIFPVPYIMKLNMSLKRRISVSCSLGLGSVACAISVYKITTIPHVVAELTTDPTYAVVPLCLWAHVEACVLVITASLPTLGPLFRWVADESPLTILRSSKNGSARNGGYQMSHQRPKKLNSTTGSFTAGNKRGFSSVVVPRNANDADINHGEGIQKSVHISVKHEDV